MHSISERILHFFLIVLKPQVASDQGVLRSAKREVRCVDSRDSNET